MRGLRHFKAAHTRRRPREAGLGGAHCEEIRMDCVVPVGIPTARSRRGASRTLGREPHQDSADPSRGKETRSDHSGNGFSSGDPGRSLVSTKAERLGRDHVRFRNLDWRPHRANPGRLGTDEVPRKPAADLGVSELGRYRAAFRITERLQANIGPPAKLSGAARTTQDHVQETGGPESHRQFAARSHPVSPWIRC